MNNIRTLFLLDGFKQESFMLVIVQCDLQSVTCGLTNSSLRWGRWVIPPSQYHLHPVPPSPTSWHSLNSDATRLLWPLGGSRGLLRSRSHDLGGRVARDCNNAREEEKEKRRCNTDREGKREAAHRTEAFAAAQRLLLLLLVDLIQCSLLSLPTWLGAPPILMTSPRRRTLQNRTKGQLRIQRRPSLCDGSTFFFRPQTSCWAETIKQMAFFAPSWLWKNTGTRCSVRVKNTVTLLWLWSPPPSEPLSGLTSGWDCKSDTTSCFLHRVTLIVSQVPDVSSMFQHLESVSKQRKKNTLDRFYIFQRSKSVYWNIQTFFMVWGCMNPRQILRISKIMLYADWLRVGKKSEGSTGSYTVTLIVILCGLFILFYFFNNDATLMQQSYFKHCRVWYTLSTRG